MKKVDWFDIISKAVMIVLMAVLIYMLILKVTGHSPTLDTIFGVTLGVLTTGMVNLYYKFGKLEGMITEFVRHFGSKSESK